MREPTRNLIQKFGPMVHPLIIDLGNEPHGTGDRVLEDMRTYQAVYDEAKKTDPSIMVLSGTSGRGERRVFRGWHGKVLRRLRFSRLRGCAQRCDGLATLPGPVREI